MKQIILNKSGHYTYTLDEEGSELEVVGTFLLKDKERLDLSVTIIHAAPHTTANTILKAVVDDEAFASISGTIIVKPGAQVTNSFLKENVLLLSDKARAEAIPNLEIEANDVKCSHAATIGKIDFEQLFYLQSRGLTPSQAKTTIAQGFLKVE
jgi:Fe-S cluster assembly protein SufD